MSLTTINLGRDDDFHVTAYNCVSAGSLTIASRNPQVLRDLAEALTRAADNIDAVEAEKERIKALDLSREQDAINALRDKLNAG